MEGPFLVGAGFITLPPTDVPVKDLSVLDGERMRWTHEERNVGTYS